MNQSMPKINCILLIDDDRVTNYLHKIVINDMEVSRHIEIKQNGKEGLQYLAACAKEGNLPELVLVDLKMPVMDGFEFVDAYRKMNLPEDITRIVMLTTSSNPKDIEKMQEKGITDFFDKPLTEEKLMLLMEKYFVKE
ncbi:response regulator [Rhodocytophaga rosea]|uniref:Response regulator n=1 Tax=Rhodocytophaga rosea TaxID=2704465 RepID=A0A6C0GQG0_9BACT|nr:response regulator [Rhodocytophaga rosea]QHT70306.1 response regulator [Rhodocytophaga rosea]